MPVTYRLIGANERMIKWIRDFVVTFSVPGSLVPDSELSERVQRAWINLRFAHPSIALTAEADTLDYTIPDPTQLGEWLIETFNVISDPDISASNLVAGLKPLPYVFILHTAHWRTDGYGALQLLDAFFKAFALGRDPIAISWGSEPARLAPSIEEVLRLPTEPTPEIKAPGGTRGVPWTFSRSTTVSILEACEAYGLKPLSAVHASLAMVNFKHQSTTEAVSVSRAGYYTSTIRLNLRPYLKWPFNTPAYASALKGTAWQDAAAYPGFLSARRDYAETAFGIMVRNGANGTVRSEVDISSVGNVDDLVVPVRGPDAGNEGQGLDLTVEEVSLGVECLAKETYLFFWIFRGKISF
ncbi:hypothetical protein GGR56DRAFT_686843 [Xylariaceae sp. FL0804]|nr:hypothetical protein GGR56DRAFT_686843 [Xylariaceae sp. FL0804]